MQLFPSSNSPSELARGALIGLFADSGSLPPAVDPTLTVPVPDFADLMPVAVAPSLPTSAAIDSEPSASIPPVTAAIGTGASLVQGTANGFGERVGNPPATPCSRAVAPFHPKRRTQSRGGPASDDAEDDAGIRNNPGSGEIAAERWLPTGEDCVGASSDFEQSPAPAATDVATNSLPSSRGVIAPFAATDASPIAPGTSPSVRTTPVSERGETMPGSAQQLAQPRLPRGSTSLADGAGGALVATTPWPAPAASPAVTRGSGAATVGVSQPVLSTGSELAGVPAWPVPTVLVPEPRPQLETMAPPESSAPGGLCFGETETAMVPSVARAAAGPEVAPPEPATSAVPPVANRLPERTQPSFVGIGQPLPAAARDVAPPPAIPKGAAGGATPCPLEDAADRGNVSAQENPTATAAIQDAAPAATTTTDAGVTSRALRRVPRADDPADFSPARPLSASTFAPAAATMVKNFLGVAHKQLTGREAPVGITVAERGPAMRPNLPPPPLPAESTLAAELARAFGMEPHWPVGESVPVAAPVAPEPATARHAVQATLDSVALLGAREPASLRLQFAIGEEPLVVRLEWHGNEIRTVFHTSSPELQGALSREWHAAALPEGERGYRFAEPQFAGTPDSTPHGSSDQAFDRRRPPGDADEERARALAARPKPMAPAPTARTDGTSRHLHLQA